MESSGTTILVVDDEEIVLMLLALYLEREGHRVLAARSGKDALALEEKETRRIDLVITDINMPVMSGLELARVLNRKRPGTPILFLSGGSDQLPVRRDEFRPAPVHFIAKPFHFARLGEAVQQLVRRSAFSTL